MASNASWRQAATLPALPHATYGTAPRQCLTLRPPTEERSGYLWMRVGDVRIIPAKGGITATRQGFVVHADELRNARRSEVHTEAQLATLWAGTLEAGIGRLGHVAALPADEAAVEV